QLAGLPAGPAGRPGRRLGVREPGRHRLARPVLRRRPPPAPRPHPPPGRCRGMSESVPQGPVAEAPWLVVVDPQVIFADPSSQWASPEFDDAMTVIERAAPAFDGRVVVTRWLPTAQRATGEGSTTSWTDYFEAWPFADRPAADPLY